MGFRLENAQTMVEFALVFPFLLLLTYGIIEFGRMIFIYTEVTGAAREGARYGAAAGTVGTIPQYADCAGIQAATQSKALFITFSSISISYDNGPGVGPTATCAQVHANPTMIHLGYRVKVIASTTYSPMIAFLGFKPLTITSYNARTIIMNVEVLGTPVAP